MTRLRAKIEPYFQKGGRDPDATKRDLSDAGAIVTAIANDPIGSITIEAAEITATDAKTTVRLLFNSRQAKAAQQEIAQHRLELEGKADHDHERVLLRFVRPSVEVAKPGKPGGERGVIASLHKKPLPILYASPLAEQWIRHEFTNAEGNIFKLLFDVDVNVELNAQERPVAYRITSIHAVIEDADDDQAA